MKILKRVLLIIALIIGIALLAALFVKKDMDAVREVTINKPKQEVFNYVKYLKNQEAYSKWEKMDPAMKKEYRGTDGTVGFVSAWDSEKGEVGKGEQEIKGIAEGERLDTELRFIEPMESTATSSITTETVSPNATKVKWAFHGKMNYPFNLMGVFMNMEKMIGDDFQTGLNNLKTVLEK
ncbi:MAG TPA: SRPBCC family protein [Flavisolibacter sp.]|nr:SRPBCC family protein [Flavisolibacter sp.]